MATTKNSRLTAVNTIISNVGQSPLNNLESGNPLAELAEGILDEVTRAVQSEGWVFNKEYCYPVNREPSTNRIEVLPNMLSLDTAPNDPMRVVIRGGYLYDVANHTNTFDKNLELDITWLVDFDDMPEVFKNYVAVRSANLFAGRTVGSAEAVKFGEREELLARAACMEYETQQGDYTMLADRNRNTTYNSYRPIDALYRI